MYKSNQYAINATVIPIRAAIKLAIRKLTIAKYTGNREACLSLYEWLQRNIKKRNQTGLNVFI